MSGKMVRAMQSRSLIFLLCLSASVPVPAQDRLPSMPGFERYRTVGGQIARSVTRASTDARWIEGGKALGYTKDGTKLRLDLATMKTGPWDGSGLPEPPAARPPNPNSRRTPPQRAQQYTDAYTMDGKIRAVYRDNNITLINTATNEETQVTTDGNVASKVKYGTGTWTYGEELNQRDGMGFSPDGKKLWLYRFDESKCLDYYLPLNVTRIQNTLGVEAYVKSGAPNPVVDLLIYDLASKTMRTVKVRHGAFDDGVGHYVYAIDWSHAGQELTFHRTNRLQNTLEWCAANPETGEVRVIARETSPNSFTDNQPRRIALREQAQEQGVPAYANKMLWWSEESGYDNVYLLDLQTGDKKPITRHKFEVGNVVKTDLVRRVIYYMARDGDMPYKMQLHRINMDGTGDVRLTNPAFHHSVNISPDGEHFIDVYESISEPPKIGVIATKKPAQVQFELAQSDTKQFTELGLKKVERIEFLAADGKTKLYGKLHFPSNFDPSKKYPLIVDVYGGPESGDTTDRFDLPSRTTEFGFLVAWFDGRGTNGRGKAFKDEMYGKMGMTEIDDQAAGVRYLAQRPYVDASRVGINGTSYGGYASIMCLLRYPDVFHAAAASSSVTAWENYDSIYTERYMSTPQLNKSGYEAGSAMTYVRNLKGRLMLYYGTADDNVHPANTYQLVRALQAAGKGFEVQVGPDRGHTGLNYERMMEFFIERLVTNP